MIKKSIFSMLIALALSPNLHAAENESRTQSTSPTVLVPNQNWGFYLGAGMGYSTNGHDAPVKGTPSHAKILGSYLMNSSDIIFDLGVGTTSHNYSSNNTQRENNAGGAMAEVAARSLFTGGWQAGVVLNDYINQGKAFGSTQRDAVFGGLQLLKEFNPTDSMALRAGGKAQMQLNNGGAPVSMAQLELHIGFGATRSANATTVAAAVPAQPKKTTAVVDDGVTVSIEAKKGTDEKLATFEVGDDHLTDDDKEYLYELGKNLKENSNQFSQLTIRGFADISGEDAMNQELSEKRAQSVRNFFISEVGIPASLIQIKGEGKAPSQRLLSSDRRIEIDLHDVKDAQIVEKILK